MLTGHDGGEQGGRAKPEDHPNIDSVLVKLRPGLSTAVPWVALPYKTEEGAAKTSNPSHLRQIRTTLRDRLSVDFVNAVRKNFLMKSPFPKFFLLFCSVTLFTQPAGADGSGFTFARRNVEPRQHWGRLGWFQDRGQV